MASISAIRAINHREATKLRKRTIELNNGRAAQLERGEPQSPTAPGFPHPTSYGGRTRRT